MFSSKIIFVFLIAVLSAHVLATVNYWYWQYFWLDMPMHFLGGFWVAMFFLWFSNKYFPNIFSENLFLLVSALSFVALIGVFWEFYEFFYDIFISSRGYSGSLGSMQLSAADTIKDLFFDLLGGSALLAVYKLKLHFI